MQLSFTKQKNAGFTLIEVLVSIAVLTIGLLGMAALICSTVVFGTNAKFINMANILASEKLDSLNKWPSTDPNVAAGGSISAPAVCATGNLWCDEVTVSQTAGATYETQTQKVFDPLNPNNPPTTLTNTIVHTSTGCVDTPAVCGVPAVPSQGSTFVRQWQITLDPDITNAAGATTKVVGARRITVLVTLTNQPTRTPVSFQMSTVRP